MPESLSPPPAPRWPGLARVLGAWRAQRWMWSEFVCAWTGRPRPSVAYARRLGDGRRFALHRGSWMSVLVPMVVFTQFVDILIAQGIIHVAAAPAHRALLHGLLLLASLWMMAWAVALRSATRHVDHVLDAQGLTLAIGLRQLCRLPLDAIADVRRIEHPGGANGKRWLERHGLRPRDVTVLTPLDPPTLLIALKDGADDAWWTRHGVPRGLAKWVAVYVDQPEALRAALAAAKTAECPPAPGSPQAPM